MPQPAMKRHDPLPYLRVLANFVELLNINWCWRYGTAGELLQDLVLPVLGVPAAQHITRNRVFNCLRGR